MVELIYKLLSFIPLRRWIYTLLLAVVAVVGVDYYLSKERIKDLEYERDVSVMNSRAVALTNRILTINVDCLQTSIDSRDVLVDSCIKALKLKPRRLTSSVYIHDTLLKVDSIRMHDTIFSKGLSIDTTIGDRWVSSRVVIKYPNEVQLTTSISNKKVVLVSKNKEIAGTPSKYWIIRLFQRKTEYLKIDISNTNPYIKEVNNKAIIYTTK